LGSGLTANRINQFNASGLYLAFVLVLLDQRFAIDPCGPSPIPFEFRVILLEPRTPHQPAKLKNVPKNEYRFTLFKFFVNQNYAFLSIAKSIECSRFTAPCHVLVQPDHSLSRNPRCWRAFPRVPKSEDRFSSATHALPPVWKSRHKTETTRRSENSRHNGCPRYLKICASKNLLLGDRRRPLYGNLVRDDTIRIFLCMEATREAMLTMG